MTPTLFSELGLSAEILKAIDQLGFEQAAPIQARAIPLLMAGRDIVGQSQTGSGKTAAFAIPAIERVDPQQRAVQVLILCPTRELAVQVCEEVHKLGRFKRGIHALPIYGGQSYERQFQGLSQGANIVIGTPGRVLDHLRRGTLRLESVRMLILDEADVMLDMGFREDMEFILQAAAGERQTVFFSATMPAAIQQLIQTHAREPESVYIEQQALTVPTVEQTYYEVDRRFKLELLTRLIDIHDLKLGIIFCNTKRMVDDLVDHLNVQGYSADRLHGDMSQAMRDRVMNKFRKSGLEFLVATDVAARGIDVDDVQVVFNYDLPYDGEDYVHRIGRTGRKGRSGLAITFVSGREIFAIRHIERYTNTRIHRARVPTPAEVEDARANVMLDKLRVTLQEGTFRRQDHLIERLLEEGFNSADIASALLHQLQGGGAEPAKKPVRQEETRAHPSTRPGRAEPQPPRAGAQVGQRRERPRPAPEPERLPKDRGSESRLQPAGPQDRTKAGLQTGSDPAQKPFQTGSKRNPKPEPKAEPEPKPPVTDQPVLERTYSDAEILASVAHPPGKPEPQKTQPETKPSRRTPEHQTRLFMSIGEEMGVAPIDIVNAIAGHTGLPGKVVGTVDIRERHLFVDVDTAHAKGIIAKLNRAEIKGRRVKVKAA
jgi:ATP-dependent RNA helicase DeaD